MSAAPAFAEVTRGRLRLLLSVPAGSGARATPEDAATGGRNRVHLIVADPVGNLVELFEPVRPPPHQARADRPCGRGPAARPVRTARPMPRSRPGTFGAQGPGAATPHCGGPGRECESMASFCGGERIDSLLFTAVGGVHRRGRQWGNLRPVLGVRRNAWRSSRAAQQTCPGGPRRRRRDAGVRPVRIGPKSASARSGRAGIRSAGSRVRFSRTYWSEFPERRLFKLEPPGRSRSTDRRSAHCRTSQDKRAFVAWLVGV